MSYQALKLNQYKEGVLLTLCAMLFLLMSCSEESSNATQLENPEKEKTEREVFTLVEEQVGFEGGIEAFYSYAAKEVRYPLEARQNGVEGEVVIQFVVERDGSLSDVKAIEGIGSGWDKAALKVIQDANGFIPASQRGRRVRVKIKQAFTFKLDKVKKNPDNSPQGSIIIGKLDAKNGQLKVEAKYANGEWAGVVRSPEGDVLPGVNIVVVGTTWGTVSDLDGTFKVKATESQGINISFVGYESRSLPEK